MENTKVVQNTKHFLSLYLADCQLEHLEYNDNTYEEAIKLARILNMPEGGNNEGK